MAAMEILPEPGWQAYQADGFAGLIGPFFWRRDEADQTVSAFRATPRHANSQGVIHGGMLMSFADHITGVLLYRLIKGKHFATVSLNSDFLAAAKVGDWVEGRTKITRQGSSLVFARATLTTAGQPLLSVGSVWKVLGAG